MTQKKIFFGVFPLAGNKVSLQGLPRFSFLQLVFLVLFCVFILFLFLMLSSLLLQLFYLLYFCFSLEIDTTFQVTASPDIKQFQCTTWPESGSPDSGIGIIELIAQVQNWNNSINSQTVTVHCRLIKSFTHCQEEFPANINHSESTIKISENSVKHVQSNKDTRTITLAQFGCLDC